MIIKYYDGKRKVISVSADSCSGEVPAGSNTFYRIFYKKGKQVARVADRNLLPGYKEKYSKLFGRPWLIKLKELKEITLHRLDINDYNVPDDCEYVWGIVGLPGSAYWVMESEGRATLHIMNNEEVTKKGTFPQALQLLFPGKKISVRYPSVKVVQIA